MYIIQPSWLTKINLYPKGTKFAISVKFDEPGNRYVLGGVPANTWTVSPNRIVVETDNESEDCGNKIGAVIEKLPESPLKAIGNNFFYEGPLSDQDSVKSVLCFDPTAPEGYEIIQRSFHLCLVREEHQFNLQLSVAKDGIELSVNVHTEVLGKGSEYAQSAARRFAQHREQAEFLIANVLKVKV